MVEAHNSAVRGKSFHVLSMPQQASDELKCVLSGTMW